MLAIQGQYQNGEVLLFGEKPKEDADVIVIFNLNQGKSETTDEKEKIDLFNMFSGSIDRKIDAEAELVEALEEKHAIAD